MTNIFRIVYIDRRLCEYNEDDLQFQIWFMSNGLTHKHEVIKKCYLKSFSLITCKLLIHKKLVNNQNLNN